MGRDISNQIKSTLVATIGSAFGAFGKKTQNQPNKFVRQLYSSEPTGTSTDNTIRPATAKGE